MLLIALLLPKPARRAALGLGVERCHLRSCTTLLLLLVLRGSLLLLGLVCERGGLGLVHE